MQISSLSDYDNIKLTATFFYCVEDRFNCQSQRSSLLSRPNPELLLKALSDRNGCECENNFSGIVDKLSGNPRYVVDEINYYSCFCNFVDASTFYIWFLWQQFEKNMLPFVGSLSDQPCKIIEAFQVLGYHKNIKQKEDAEKEKRKSNVRRKH